jgi:hypothetical protein
MRRAVVGVLFVLAVVTAVVVLRNGLPAPVSTGPDQQQVTAEPVPEPVVRTVVSGMDWRQVPLPGDIDQAHLSEVDGSHAVFPVRGTDGVRRLVSRSGDVDSEVGRGSGGSEPLNATLDGGRLVVYEVTAGVTKLSTVDLATGSRAESTLGFPAEAIVVSAGSVAAQENLRCLTFLDTVTLDRRSRRCVALGWSISLLTAETDAVQWRETTSVDPCTKWFHLDPSGTPQQVQAGQQACRAASLVRAGDWELTAAFPPYELGALYPGPLVARRGNREIALDATVLDVHTCGGHVYWLSKLGNADQRGELVRWTPGEARVDTLSVGPAGSAAPPRCVNGVLNVVTYGPGAPQLWTLMNP